MKFFFVIIFTCISILKTNAQKKQFIYYFDSSLNSTESSNAVLVGKGMQDSGLLKLNCFSKKEGILLMKMNFTDSGLSVLQGLFQTFYRSGQIESEGSYFNNLKEGTWMNYDSTGSKTDSLNFNKDQLVSSATYIYWENKMLRQKFFVDLKLDHYLSDNFTNEGILEYRAESFGDKGSVTLYKGTETKVRPLSSVKKIPAEFPGGHDKFKNYLIDNINTSPIRVKIKPGNYVTVVNFTVEKNGNLSDITTENGIGYGFEEELIKVIKNSPLWSPATQLGIPLKYIIRQPVAFSYNEGVLRYIIQ